MSKRSSVAAAVGISLSLAGAALTVRGESLAAFDGRCIPADGDAPRSNTPGILGRRALLAGRLARLGATPDFRHGLPGAQNAAAHLVWMDEAGDAQEEVRSGIHANKPADVARAAAKIEDLMARTQAYWDAKHEPEAVRMAQDARTLAKQIAASATAAQLDQADAAFGKMQIACNACHGLHLEKH